MRQMLGALVPADSALRLETLPAVECSIVCVKLRHRNHGHAVYLAEGAGEEEGEEEEGVVEGSGEVGCRMAGIEFGSGGFGGLGKKNGGEVCRQVHFYLFSKYFPISGPVI